MLTTTNKKIINNYPYQNSFENYLKNIQKTSPATIEQYTHTLTRLFKYLSNFNSSYQKHHKVNLLLNRDIEDYLNNLIQYNHLRNSTYNKMLSHINMYFKFLVKYGFSHELPTLFIKSKKNKSDFKANINWIQNIDEILKRKDIRQYTKMTLLLNSKGYSYKAFLQPGFYKEMKFINFSDTEKAYLNEFKKFIYPLQLKQNSKDIFLKSRFCGNTATLNLPALHRYLKLDEKTLKMNLNPSKLHADYMVYFIHQYKNDTDFQLAEKLGIDFSSVNYYRKLYFRSVVA